MAKMANEIQSKWTHKAIAARVYEILSRYTDFDSLAKHSDTPFENQPLYLDSLDLIEISMYLEHDFNIEIDIFNDIEYFAGNYTLGQFVKYVENKLNIPDEKNKIITPAKNNDAADWVILMRSIRNLPLQKFILREYGVRVSANEIRATKSFTEYQAVIKRAIAQQKTK